MNTHTQRFKIRLGLFIVGGLALFVLAIFIIGKQKNLFNPVFKLTTTFYNVSGLQVGNNIRFSGIDVGTVDNITIINDSTVMVDMMVKKEVMMFIKSDSKVAIGSEGLIGDRLLVITQGSTDAPLAKDGQKLDSKEPVETDAIMASLVITSANAEIITEQLAEIMIKVNSGRGTLGRLIHDTIIAQDIKATIINFKQSSNGLNEIMDATRQDISTLMGSFNVTARNAESFSQHLDEVIVKVNSRDGTIGRLIQDSTIAENINQTIIHLNNSSLGLEENMEALKHNIFFRRYFRKKAEKEEKLRLEAEKKKIEIIK